MVVSVGQSADKMESDLMGRKSKIDQVDIRQRILLVAGNLMTQKGIKETSLQDIAKEVGISKGTLYYYYSAKEDIIYDIADNHLRVITDEILTSIDEGNSDVEAEHILRGVFEKILSAETRGKLHLYLISDAVINNSSLKNRFREKYSEWRTTLEDSTKKVLAKRETDYKVISVIILALLDGLIIQRMLGADQIPLEEVSNVLAKIE